MEDRILSRVREYVRESFLYTRPDLELGVDEPLISSGVIDSMGVLELIEFLQSEFGIEIADDEITEDNLGTLRAIAAFTRSRSVHQAALAARAS